MKKFLATLGTSLMGFAALAVEDGSIDLSAATTTLTSVKTALVGWVSTALPLLSAIAGAFLVFWLGKMIFRLVKGWTSTAK